ncbi:reverse transcriptase domain-containing protein [Tanacetum coccineum]
MNDDTPMCERHEANYIQYEGYENRNSHDSYSYQSHRDPNDSEKSLKELNNDVKNNLEDFKRRIRSMRTIHDKLFDRDDQSKTDLKKLMTKFLDDQRVTKQTDRTDPPPPQAHTEHVNAVFTGSGKSDDSPKIQKAPRPPIIVNNKIRKDKPIKTSKKGYHIAMDSQIISLNEELQDMREKYNELRNGNASKNHLNDDTPMCERREANYIQSEDYQNRNSYDSFSHQSLHDPNDSEKSLTELNIDVRNDLEDFKRHRTEPPPPPQAQTEHVNVVFTRSGMSDDSSKIQKDPPPPIIVNNKIKKGAHAATGMFMCLVQAYGSDLDYVCAIE